MIFEFVGINFNSNVPDHNSCLWFITEFEGWGSPGTRTTAVDPTSVNGQILAQNLLNGRALGVKVLMKAPTEESFWTGYNRLLNLTEELLYDAEDFIVHEGQTRRGVKVVRTGDTRSRIVGVCAAEFDLTLTAYDPKKFVVTD